MTEMSLGEDIRDRFNADSKSIIEDNLDRLDGYFKYHDDGTIQLDSRFNDTGRESQILVYLIARRLMFEADDAETQTLETPYFYGKFPVGDSAVRNSFVELRDAGFVKSDDGEHQIVVENLGKIVDAIQEDLGE